MRILERRRHSPCRLVVETPTTKSAVRVRVRTLTQTQGPKTRSASCTQHDAKEAQSKRTRDPLRRLGNWQLQFPIGSTLATAVGAGVTRVWAMAHTALCPFAETNAHMKIGAFAETNAQRKIKDIRLRPSRKLSWIPP